MNWGHIKTEDATKLPSRRQLGNGIKLSTFLSLTSAVIGNTETETLTGLVKKTQQPAFAITAQPLARIKSIDFWAEGVAGKVHLEVMSVMAEDL